MENIITTEFQEFKKIPRLSRDIIITEKLDGTNGVIYIGETGEFLVGSRSRWITPVDDNHGFARWAYSNKADLFKLGPGWHYGEWWGSGINRGYGLVKGEKRFSLFNSGRWIDYSRVTIELKEGDNRIFCPPCCYVVPILWAGNFNTSDIDSVLDSLALRGSQASPGFMNPEGIVIYHVAARHYFKKTIKNDEMYKGEIIG